MILVTFPVYGSENLLFHLWLMLGMIFSAPFALSYFIVVLSRPLSINDLSDFIQEQNYIKTKRYPYDLSLWFGYDT